MTYGVTLPERGTFAAWREAARCAISHRIPPDRIDWNGVGGLFAASPLPDHTGEHEARVPQAFLKLAGSVIWHADPERLALLYQALWRIDRKEGNPLSQADPLGRRLNLMARAVGRDIHKMHAFVRFRELPSEGARRSFAAWFEPEHNTLEPGSAFFARRFADMDWLIATPRLTARFEAGRLSGFRADRGRKLRLIPARPSRSGTARRAGADHLASGLYPAASGRGAQARGAWRTGDGPAPGGGGARESAGR